MLLLPTCCFSLENLPVCGKSDIYMLSAKSRPAKFFVRVHFMPVSSLPGPLFVALPSLSESRKSLETVGSRPASLSYSRFTSKDSVSFPLWITWHA
uniref:Uncharacterized protein n=1 Tax=Trichobilharzia regenti TaxID=157069 RepID=A0AA85JVM8_TRIRE|nr:unnamed protein product [Trichobilharzia regenti]